MLSCFEKMEKEAKEGRKEGRECTSGEEILTLWIFVSPSHRLWGIRMSTPEAARLRQGHLWYCRHDPPAVKLLVWLSSCRSTRWIMLLKTMTIRLKTASSSSSTCMHLLGMVREHCWSTQAGGVAQ